LRRAGEARASQLALGLIALSALAATAGCKSTASCNPGTVFVSVDFDTATRAADTIEVQVSIDGGAAKSSSIAHMPGDAGGTVEVDFPSGYPSGKSLDVTIVARSGQTVLGSGAGMFAAVPGGCGTLEVSVSGGNDGGAGTGGGTGRGGTGGATGGSGGAKGGAGGSAGGGGVGGSTGGTGGSIGGSGGAAGGTGGGAGAAGRGGSGGTAGGTGGATGGTGGTTACTNGTTRSCSADGKLGSCAAGTETCTSGVWGACSIAAAAADSCVQGNDDNCNGTKNEGCSCINSVTTKACGICGDGTQTCSDGKTGTYGACTGANGQDFTPLTLQNGWTTYTGTSGAAAAPAVALDCSGNVVFRGGMQTSGTNTTAFTLPANLRPSANVYLPVDGYFAAKVRLIVATTGAVSVYAPSGTATDATSFTSLEGASFALSSTGYTALSLTNGWAQYSGARAPAVSVSGGIVRFQGGISGGTTNAAFTLPASMTPSIPTYVTADLYFGAQGRLNIQTNGIVAVIPQSGTLADATSFTSLEGVWFALGTTGYTPLSLINSWATYGGTRAPAAQVSGGIVRLQGAMMTGATNNAPFVLPVGMRPASAAYVPVDLYGGAKGRINIFTDGTVTVQAAGNVTSNFMMLTSLEGVFFGL
jgi:hypothetical protein